MSPKKSNSRKFSEPRKPVGTVAELFAGVGGFRLGLASAGWQTVFSNQWEPSTQRQHASEVYVHRFGEAGHSNEDIARVLDAVEEGTRSLPSFDLLVGGFPCQDYSVAKTLNTSKGIAGKKGVLWWEILRLVQLKKPKMLLLENVDRLLKSPASRRGRDFAVMLASLSDEGYVVEWRVVNAAEYGFPQRRRRVFIVAKRISAFPSLKSEDLERLLIKSGVMVRSLPIDSTVIPKNLHEFRIDGKKGDLAYVSASFGKAGAMSPFMNGGVMRGRKVVTAQLESKAHDMVGLASVLLDPSDSRLEGYWVPKESWSRWDYLKGPKKELRTHMSGQEYYYSEGGMSLTDDTKKPARTILTGEGGSSPSRFKHIIKVGQRRRRLTPIELERLNGFPDDWTVEGTEGPINDARRAFFMGNALVIGIVEMIGNTLARDMREKKR